MTNQTEVLNTQKINTYEYNCKWQIFVTNELQIILLKTVISEFQCSKYIIS